MFGSDGGGLLWVRETTSKSFESFWLVVAVPVVRSNGRFGGSLKLASNMGKGRRLR